MLSNHCIFAPWKYLSRLKQKIPTYWFVLLGYLLISLLVVFVQAPESYNMSPILINRGIFLALLTIIIILKDKIEFSKYQLISLLIAYAFLGTIYKETALLNTLIFSKQDALVSHWDEVLFGFQPAIEFSKNWSNPFFSELMFASYFSYYIIPLFIIIRLYKSGKLNHFGFILITSFTIYYFIFDIFPVEGPQYYYSSPENYIEAKGIFGKIIKIIQNVGEAPTAAFPSSHVGISCIILLWLYYYYEKILIYVIPFAGLLFFATVYIKAHYAVDALAGIISGWLIFTLLNLLYPKSIKEY